MSPDTVDPDAVTTTSLTALQSGDQRKVLDIVGKLRRIGLAGLVELPQIVVCGDQSSGKSSVLEAITEIPFPRKENLCTRFATEITLRRSTSSKISITINPDKLRTQQEIKKLKSFNEVMDDFKQLPTIIDAATEAMGLGIVGGTGSRAISRDVLSVQIDGPGRPQLTLVDLPGLIHSTNRAQTDADKQLILNLVTEYMNNERTIILAVVSAKNDFANQIILDYARRADSKGRTLGIITKPDYLREGSDNELSWIDLAQNKDIFLERGWHMLKNRADDQMAMSFAERNTDEQLFFGKGRYAHLPRDCVGIDSLRERLSKVLLNHLIKELPSLKEEMDIKLQDTIMKIEQLGEKRNTPTEQRIMLTRISMRVNEILHSAVEGHYENPFFGNIDMDSAVDSKENVRRFRAVIQHLNLKFADDMRLRGHKFSFGLGPGDDEAEQAEDSKARSEVLAQLSISPKPTHLSRKAAIAWVKKTLERSRGYELPGTFQPMLVSHLFWEQSRPWEQIASDHIAGIACICKEFVHAVIRYTVPPDFFARLNGLIVDAALTEALNGAKEELKKILNDKNRHPMTYNHYFTDTIQKQRIRKYQKLVKENTEVPFPTPIAPLAQSDPQEWGLQFRQAPKKSSFVVSTVVEPQPEQAPDEAVLERNMDNFSSEEALDSQRAYYKDEMKYFVNAVCKAVVERHLVEPLPDMILSPVMVAEMTPQQVEFIAAEAPEVSQQRQFLEGHLAMLAKGLETFRETMGGFRS